MADQDSFADVFISHNSRDKERFVRQLVADLEQAGVSCWLDEKQIRPGTLIPSAVGKGLEQCRFVVIVLSQNSTGSNWVEFERDIVLMSQLSDSSKTIIPILLEDCERPSILSAIAYADFHTDHAEGLKQLLRTLKPDASFAESSATDPPPFTVSAADLPPLTAAAKAADASSTMTGNTTLHIRQNAPADGKYPIRLTLKRPGQPDLEAEATIAFALTAQEQEDLRWYLEDYLQYTESVEDVHVEQVETLMKQRGEELYNNILTTNQNTQAIWFAMREQLADLRVEIATGIAEAASIPWELMRDPQSDSPIALRVKSFVRVQLNPNLSFVPIPEAEDGRVRLLYVVCRPGGTQDVALRAVANRLLQDLGDNLALYDITALRPPTFEQLQKELTDAKEAGRPYHIVHFDGHGMYADLSTSTLAEWVAALSSVALGGKNLASMDTSCSNISEAPRKCVPFPATNSASSCTTPACPSWC